MQNPYEDKTGETQPPQKNPTSTRGTLSIAILLISAFIIFIGIIIARVSLDKSSIETVGAIWGPWVGAILGYFFGSRSSEPLAEDNKNLSREVGKKDQKLTQNKELLFRYRNETGDNILKLTKARSDISTTNILPENLNPLDEVLDDLKNAKDLLDKSIDSI